MKLPNLHPLLVIDERHEHLHNPVVFSNELNSILKRMWSIYYQKEDERSDEDNTFFAENTELMTDYYAQNSHFWTDQHGSIHGQGA